MTFQQDAQRSGPINAQEAFRLIDAGVEAEKSGRFENAYRHFLEGGHMLEKIVDLEPDEHIRSLLYQKALEVVGWTERLADFIEHEPHHEGERQPPSRKGRIVQIDLGPTAGNQYVSAIQPGRWSERGLVLGF